MEDGDGGDTTPFWVQSTTNNRRADRLRRHVSAAFFSSGLVVFLLLVTAAFFLVFVVPSSLSFSAQIFKPNSVKKSWDSLNVLLVLVAVIFGFLSRNKNDDKYNSYYDEFQASSSKQNGSQKSSNPNSNPSTPTNNWYNKFNYPTNEGQKSNLSNSSQWYEYSGYEPKLEHKNSILARNSNSYPDLRDFSTTHWSYGDYYQRRYYDDDIHVDSGRAWNPDLGPDQGQVKLHRRHRSLEGVEHLRAIPQNKTVIVDTLLSKSKGGENFQPPEMAAAAVPLSMEESAATGSERTSAKLNKDFEPLDPVTAQKLPQPPPAAVEAPEITENPELAYERVRRKKERSGRKRNKELEPKDPVTTPSPQGDPSPSPPSPPRQKSTHRKRVGATGSSTKDFLNSLYTKKKKKQRQKSVDNLDPVLHEAQVPLSSQPPPPSHPPPPPPPPPPSVFQNLFSSKKQKRKRTITVTLAPQSPSLPPSQPPPAAAREPEPTSQTAPTTTHKPPKPTKMTAFDRLEENSNSGGDSPLNRIPPPPPPPPAAFFKGPAWKFVVQGDYVRVNSSTSSRSGSPDTDDGESDVTPSAVDAGGTTSFQPSPLFCPSPDVDTKAESFITNFRAKLKLEKIHSMRKKDVGLSGLGPGPSQFSPRN
ncbi:hypothetical protein CASFOL_025928 [Castilleja foliolosa]|uniref:Uncharacterized protein n=1 Tax=Castilleja foliolosa TaxID=1961234 RepID=A0ABD3CV16_9LAMI